MAAKSRGSVRPENEMRERIVDAALELGEALGWEAVRLYDVAEAAGLGLEDIRRHFKEKEAITDAWFDRADRALLEAAGDPEVMALPSRERLHRLIMAWLEALAPHRRVTREIIWNRLEPGHLHVQLPSVLRISRTVQWIREAARREATFLRRAIEETALTGIFVTTFCYWLRDDSQDLRDTRRVLDGLLGALERLERGGGDARSFRGRTPPEARTEDAGARAGAGE
ncbi:MAG: TetR family transcriptional regulator [Gammaproteobacteria bacterium]|nr:TetR family transcriptional regulator [Gammaproteobacteria bacterium]NIR82515.1 TetR family transcriptional regulator [Gammaproteobacteria bacterium]NIU03646.1 TetR family transcriptional regulator [Gammaproteobacteria bacterium]NIX84920.1 TetR family transcriptional regulator [Gammaproteobacteria bacterium]